MTTQLEAAYLAGLVDGEGCIHLGTRKGTYRGRVTIGMTAVAKPLLEDLQKTWAGGIYQSRPETEKWSAAWVWSVQGEPARKLLLLIEPHLRLKRKQAQLALEVERIRASLPRRPNGSGSWTPEAQAECEEIKQKLHVLNKKGPRAQNAEVA